MWTSKQFLERCSKLSDGSTSKTLEPGQRVGRGFADLGYEEFLVLPGEKLLSLFTGQVSQLNDENRRFLFPIPSVKQLINHIQLAGYDLISVTFEEQRRWKLVMRRSGSSESPTIEHVDLEGVLLEALLWIKGSGDV